MRRILVVTAFVPSRIGAGENFTRQMINDLSAFNHIDLIYFKYHADKDYVRESENVSIIKVYSNNTIIKIINFLSFPFLFPLFTVRFNLFRMLYIKKLIRKSGYHCILLDFSQTFLFGRFIRNLPVILNCHDVIAQRYSRIYYGFFLPLVRTSERFVLKGRNYKIFNHSEKDSILLNQIYSIKSEVTSLYFDEEVLKTIPAITDTYFVFFANWKRRDNLSGLIWFLNYVQPSLGDDLKFVVIGSGLTFKMEKRLTELNNFQYLGFVDNPYPVISNAAALISPLFTGAGIKVKVMEALACGTPVIGTHIAFEGVSLIFNKFMIQANTSEEFISALNGFRNDIGQKQELKGIAGSYDKRHSISDFIRECY
jgi:glycosyltransferase involved in cell wall biosynthesis